MRRRVPIWNWLLTMGCSRQKSHRSRLSLSLKGAIRPQPCGMRRRLQAGSCFVQQSLDVETVAMTRFFSCISYLLVMAVGICGQTTGPARSTVLRAERMLDVRQGTIGRSPIIAIQAGKIVRVNEPPPAFFSTNLGPGTRWE